MRTEESITAELRERSPNQDAATLAGTTRNILREQDQQEADVRKNPERQYAIVIDDQRVDEHTAAMDGVGDLAWVTHLQWERTVVVGRACDLLAAGYTLPATHYARAVLSPEHLPDVAAQGDAARVETNMERYWTANTPTRVLHG